MTSKATLVHGAKDPILLVLAGPAGSGKSTLCDRLVAEGIGFSRVVTSTTRSPRKGESHGVHYHFFTPTEFDRRAKAGEFLEWAWVHGDRRYGTLAASVLGPLLLGKSLVMSVDVQGVESLRRIAAKDGFLRRVMSTVFIVVDRDRLLGRMRERGKDDEPEIARRMATAEAELREASKFDYVIESKTRDEDFEDLLGILRKVAAARAGTGRAP
ncbi:MAG TPA: guanylate kinase [Opitutaceae bacterium]|jgi:guanylate kinase